MQREKEVKRTSRRIIVLVLVTIVAIILTSCSLEQQAGHMQSFRMPIFSSYASIPRAIYMDQQTNNEKQYFLSLPPVIGWETANLSAEEDTIDFDFLDTTVTCTVDVQEDRVVFSGANESVNLTFTVYDDDRFSYTGIILTERNNGQEVNYWTIFQSTLEGEITENFISGTGQAKAWEVTPQHSFNESEPAEDTGTLIYLTYEVGEQEGIPYFAALTFDETAKDTSYYLDPNTPLTIDSWEAKEALFDTVFDTQSLTVARFTLYLNNGSWVPAD